MEFIEVEARDPVKISFAERLLYENLSLSCSLRAHFVFAKLFRGLSHWKLKILGIYAFSLKFELESVTFTDLFSDEYF